MLYLANPCGPAVITAMESGVIGMIDQPNQNKVTGVEAAHAAGTTWCADNGCFSDKWDERKWWQFLIDNAHRADTCLFAVAPDVVGDAAATLEKSAPWLPKIRGLGYPVAFVAQNGFDADLIPWDAIDVLFIGGDDAFKLGAEGIAASHEAKVRGKSVHAGRINSDRRWRFAAAPYPYGLGADSADGTYLTFGPDVNLPKLLAWTRNNDQPDLFGEPA